MRDIISSFKNLIRNSDLPPSVICGEIWQKTVTLCKIQIPTYLFKKFSLKQANLTTDLNSSYLATCIWTQLESLNIVGYLYTCVHVFLTFDPKFDLRFRLPDPENIRFNHLLTINGQSQDASTGTCTFCTCTCLKVLVLILVLGLKYLYLTFSRHLSCRSYKRNVFVRLFQNILITQQKCSFLGIFFS